MAEKDEATMLIVGDAKFQLAPLTLGVARKGGLLNDMKSVAGMRAKDLPGVDEFEAMINIVGASVRLADPIATTAVFDAAIDKLPFVDALKVVAEGFRKVMVLSKFDKVVESIQGEQASPPS